MPRKKDVYYMCNVLLVSPSSNAYYTLTAPLGLSYIAAQLKDCFRVYGLDLNVYKQEYQFNDEDMLRLVKQIINDYSIKYVAISILEETLEQAEKIARICKSLDICCIAGGIYPTLFPDNISSDFQYNVRGDGEYVIKDLLLALENHTSVKEIIGLSYYSYKHNRWLHNGNAAAITCKDGFLPDRDVFSLLHGSYQYMSARLITSRGCIYHCSFCTNRVFQSRYMRRKLTDIVAEVKELVRQGIKEIIFADDQFLGTTENEYQQALDIIVALKNILIKNNIRINFQVRADHWLKSLDLVPQLCEELSCISSQFVDKNAKFHTILNGHEMHGVGIDVGIESFVDRKLKLFKKGLTSRENIRCIRSILSLPVDLGIYSILFTPDITMEEVISEIKIFYAEYLNRGNKSKTLLANYLTSLIPYRGSDVYNQLIASGNLIPPRGYHFNDIRVAAFYAIVTLEIEGMIYRNDVSFEDVYNALIGFADYCCRLSPSGKLKDALRLVTVNQSSNLTDIYSSLLLHD